VAEGRIDLSPAAPMAETLAALAELPGIGPGPPSSSRCACSLARCLSASDIGVLRALGVATAAQASACAEAGGPGARMP
jgi:hypothetical protein